MQFSPWPAEGVTERYRRQQLSSRMPAAVRSPDIVLQRGRKRVSVSVIQTTTDEQREASQSAGPSTSAGRERKVSKQLLIDFFLSPPSQLEQHFQRPPSCFHLLLRLTSLFLFLLLLFPLLLLFLLFLLPRLLLSPLSSSPPPSSSAGCLGNGPPVSLLKRSTGRKL